MGRRVLTQSCSGEHYLLDDMTASRIPEIRCVRVGAPGLPRHYDCAPVSRVIAAMEAAIDLRQQYDNGEAGGLNISVANLSLGGPTNAAARKLDDEAVEALINADIVPVVAAGNEGHSSVTTGSLLTSECIERGRGAETRNDGVDHVGAPQPRPPWNRGDPPRGEDLHRAGSTRQGLGDRIQEVFTPGP
jgi:hypothetical protein